MLDLFLKLIDRIINLVKTRERNRQILFSEIIEPLFIDLRPIVDTYFQLFGEIRELMLTDLKISSRRLQHIKEERCKYLQTRIKVTEMAITVHNTISDEKVVDFTEAVLVFFFPTQRPPISDLAKPKSLSRERRRRAQSSAMAQRIEFLEKYDFSTLPMRERVVELDKTVARMEASWGTIAQKYALLRVHCLLPLTNKPST